MLKTRDLLIEFVSDTKLIDTFFVIPAHVHSMLKRMSSFVKHILEIVFMATNSTAQNEKIESKRMCVITIGLPLLFKTQNQ